MNPPPPIHVLDLDFQGLPEAIAAFAVIGPGGTVLVECGPTSTLPRLVDALASLGVVPAAVTDVLVTHVHLDHAGSAGWWAAQGATIHVHARGKRHLADPARLLASAARVYGADLHRLWGSMQPVAEDRLQAHEGDDPFEVAGLGFRSIDTPGHAVHHLAYALGDEVFTGDVAGIRLPGCTAVVAPTPPPDIDPGAWRASLERIRRLRPAKLHLTHFGSADGVDAHLDAVAASLEASLEQVADGRKRGLDRDALVGEYSAWSRLALTRRGLTGRVLDAYVAANPPGMAVDGLLRCLELAEASKEG